jgi:hypothetical protein
MPQLLRSGTVADTENRFLDWFGGLGVPISEELMTAGHLEYFNFSCFSSQSSGRVVSSHGRSVNRRGAALKCAGEFVERRAMNEFFANCGASTLASKVNLDTGARETEFVRLPPKSVFSSNGWAVHTEQKAAATTAINEALERHLLLKSFLKFGWAGFNLIHKTQGDDISLWFLSSKLESYGKISGLVVAKSANYPGVSFGYCLGKTTEVQTSAFWDSGLFEAVDKFSMLRGRTIDLCFDLDCWMLARTKKYLETPFDFSVLPDRADECIPCDQQEIFIKEIDLTAKWNLKFPLYAAFSWGKGIIPLFDTSDASLSTSIYLGESLAANDIRGQLPVESPVL